ncbi:MAG TPA: 2OG-Fe(II) oxygenase family protein [Sphingomonadales bacterium]|nr:2OG-Fe(II) oxygenase family protein [Sphingomonadales bacterium]
MVNPAIRLNPKLDINALAAAFAGAGRVHIADVLEEEAAQRVHACLVEEIAWNLTWCDEEGTKNLFARERASKTQQELQAIRAGAFERARSGKFQFLYSNFAVEDAYRAKLIDDLYLARFYEFLNAEPFLSAMRTVTGAKTIVHADLQATAYGPGHFLTEHNDLDVEKGRKVAFVFNFTPEWKAEWGGILQIIEEGGRTLHGLVPAFNALNLFKVPTRHVVTQVATFAPAVRLSLTGWLTERA